MNGLYEDNDGIYSMLAPFYDSFNGEIDYKKWAKFIDRIVRNNFPGNAEYILDLGCGTGNLTLELAKLGYDMIGADISDEMLDIARKKADKERQKNILWICQDMTEFELYGTVEAVVSSLDCVNHLLSEEDVQKCFSLVHNYLVPNGVFIFDINSRFKFENVYGQNVYAFETDDAFCCWENDYSDKDKICDFYITLFKKQNDGKYVRTDSFQSEKMYETDKIRELLEKSGMQLLSVYSDIDFGRVDEKSERIHFVARAIKP